MRTPFLLSLLLVVSACSHADITGPRQSAADNAIVATSVPLSHLGTPTGTSPSPAGLVACYSGRYTGQDVVGGHNATASGSVSYVPGYFGTAFSINDNTADIVAPAAPSWDLSAGDGISLAAWFFPKGVAWGPSLPGSGPIAEFDNGSHIWVITQGGILNQGDGMTSFFADFATSSATSGWHISQMYGVVAQNAWNHGVATYSKSSGEIRLYVNGVLVNTTSAGVFSPGSGTNPFHIGARDPGSFGSDKYAFNGVIDEVQVYNRALTAAEIGQMYGATGTMCVPPAMQFEILQQPSTTAESGVPLAVQPWIALLDASGNIVINGNLNVTASLAPGSTGTLSGTTTIQADSGIARFTNLTINGGGTNQLQFTVDTLPRTGAASLQTTTVQVIRKLGIVTQPVGGPSGFPFPTQPVVELQDAAGLHMTGTNPVSVAIASGAGTLSGTVTVTAVNGFATFTDLSILGAGTTALAFSSTGLVGATSANVVTTPLGASTLSLVPPNGSAGGPLQAESGVPFSTQPVVNIVDALGGVVQGATNVVTASLSTAGGTLLGTLAVSAVNGVATFTNLQVNAPSGNYVLTFTTPSIGSTTTTVAVHQVTRSFALLVDGSNLYSGMAIRPAPAVELRDAAGLKNLTGTDNVTVSGYLEAVEPFTGTTTVQAIAGVATFPNVIVTGISGYGQPVYGLIFSAPGAQTLPRSGTYFVWMGTHPTNIAVATAPAGAESGVPFTTPPAVKVVDTLGVTVTTATNVITASLTSGTGQLMGTTTATAIGGIATFTGLQLNGIAGDYQLTFSTPNLPSVTTTVHLTQVVHQLVVTTQPPPLVTSGIAFTPQPIVTLLDAAGIRVSSSDAITATTPSFGGPWTVNAVNGVAAFSGLTLTGSGSTAITFADGAVTTTSSAIAVRPPLLAVATQPDSAFSGFAFFTQPVVRILDATGALLTSANVPVTVSIASGPGGTLSGLTTVTANNGVATFSGLSITSSGTYTLAFTSPGVTAASSAALAVQTPLIPAEVGLAAQPSSTSESGVQLAVQPVVVIRDASGNRVLTSSAPVTVRISGGDAANPSRSAAWNTLGGTVTVNAVRGVATFTDLVINGSGDFTLTFTSPRLESAASGAITTSQVARALVITRQPSDGSSDKPLSTPPKVEVHDAADLLVKDAHTTITAAIATGTGTLSGKTVVNTTNGLVTFANLSISGTGSFSLRFSAPGLSSVTSTVFNVSAK